MVVRPRDALDALAAQRSVRWGLALFLIDMGFWSVFIR